MPYQVIVYNDSATFRKLYNAVEKVPIGLEGVLDDTAEDIANRMRDDTPSGQTGQLRSSIKVWKKETRARTIGPTPPEGSRKEPLPRGYAPYVEGGSQAHWPNIADLKRRFPQFSDGEAFLVARAISRRMSPGRGFVKSAYRYAVQKFLANVQRYINNTIR